MDTKRLIAAVGMISLITLTGAGCSKGSTSNGSSNGSNNTSNGDDNYNASLNLEIPNTAAKALNDKAQGIVQSVFGGVKITSFLENFPAKGGMTVEYTANRTVSANDVTKMTNAVKAAGFTVDLNGVEEGSGAIISHNDKDTLMFTFQIGQSKIGAIFGPKDELPTDDGEDSSS